MQPSTGVPGNENNAAISYAIPQAIRRLFAITRFQQATTAVFRLISAGRQLRETSYKHAAADLASIAIVVA